MLTNKDDILGELLELTRRRTREQKLRIGVEQSLLSAVKREVGYTTDLSDVDRKEIGKRASAVISAAIGKVNEDDIPERDRNVLDDVRGIVEMHYGIVTFHHRRILDLEKPIVALINKLPIAEWIHADEQRGLGALNVATILGETGDLSNYDSPSKVFKRMGCAPFKGKQPSSWRRTGGLVAKEWVEAAYSPRRRSIMFVVADCLIKANRIKDKVTKEIISVFPYRARYDEAKLKAAESHPDWKKCHLHAHANLLCGKRLLRELWREWHRREQPFINHQTNLTPGEIYGQHPV